MVMDIDLDEIDGFTIRRLRLATLTATRWLAVLGQSLVLAIVAGYLEFPLPIMPSIALIAASAILNIFVTWMYPANQRLEPYQAMAILLFDIVQLAALLYLTGGLTNPFSILLIVPAIISAATLPVRYTFLLTLIVAVAASILGLFHLPLPWEAGSSLIIPFVFVVGLWGALISCLLFAVLYVYRVAAEARRLSDALAATELVIQREQHLSALDGMAAAAAHELGTPLATISLVSKEMDRATFEDDPLKEDITLLRTQADRCREILSRLSTLGTDDEDPITRMPIMVMIEEIVAPHREFGVEISTIVTTKDTPEPTVLRNTGLIYGLGNIVENAVDFAKSKVLVFVSWENQRITVHVQDDGPGYASEQLTNLGEPDIRNLRGAERSRKGSEGLGLGIFIAKTLIERAGADIVFANGSIPGVGADVKVSWPLTSKSRLSA
ncbi:ActS/PrrB/RegB family redox-sensitive histidine kinase [Ahrensia kielensis]|uniref:histidine kinase n=1 Tax=Ahrensia kielensis TaxID=76980 RepID=A0ABU9T9F9_9HYPH